MSEDPIYIFELEPINPDASGKYFNEWLKKEHGVLSIAYHPEKVEIGFQEEPSQSVKDAIKAKYDGLTESDIPQVSLIKDTYDRFEEDGRAYFSDIRASLVAQWNTNSLTDDQIIEIENKLEKVITKLRRGDWVTAQYEMTQIAHGGSLSEELYTDIKDYIDTYVVDNYSKN